jgi:dCMP deaminase
MQPNILKSKLSTEEAILAVCKLWAESRSKDPSTKVGACIYDPVSGGLFIGYNGFPVGVPDAEETWNQRETTENKLTKYELVIHAEVNAVRKALRAGVDLSTASLVCTHIPCAPCMKNVVLASGIKRVVYELDTYPSREPRESKVVGWLAKIAGVEMVRLESDVPSYFTARNAALDEMFAYKIPKLLEEPVRKRDFAAQPQARAPTAPTPQAGPGTVSPPAGQLGACFTARGMCWRCTGLVTWPVSAADIRPLIYGVQLPGTVYEELPPLRTRCPTCVDGHFTVDAMELL